MIWKAFATYRKGAAVWTDVWIIEADNKEAAEKQLPSTARAGYANCHQATTISKLDLSTPAWVGER